MSKPRRIGTREITATLMDFMARAGYGPEFVHAVKKTGRLVNEQNCHRLTDAEIDEWDRAVEEGEKLHSAPDAKCDCPRASGV